MHGNAGLVIGDHGVLVIDATYLPDRSARDIALIRRVPNLPVGYLVTTHWRGDHIHGNGVYGDSFHGIAIVGRGNSPHDVIVYLPDERVLFAGDILVWPLPYISGASPMPWIDVLRTLEREYPVSWLVPRHGAVMESHDYTNLIRETSEMVRSQIDSSYRRGVSLTPTVARMNIEGQRTKVRESRGRPDQRSGELRARGRAASGHARELGRSECGA